MHIYAIRDMPSHLALSYKAYKDMTIPSNKGYELNGPFSANKSGQTPLSLSLNAKYTESINVTLDFLRTRIRESPRIGSIIENSLIDLNELGASLLDEFYISIFAQRENNFKKFVSRDTNLPIVIYSDNMEYNSREIDIVHEGVPIVYYSSALKLNLECGSSESIKFLKSMMKCPNSDIFGTLFIETILKDK